MNHRKRHISFFSGIGGFDLAAQWIGWENVLHCEINPFCQRVLKYYWPNAVTVSDIKNHDFSEYADTIDICTGGFPCQGFSLAGKRLGTDDARYLWPEMRRSYRQIKPRVIVGENVTGILSMEDKSGVWSEIFPRMEGRKIVRYDTVDHYEAVYTRQAKMLVTSICEDLEEDGYEVQPFAIPACAVGAPHKRERIWFIAYNKAFEWKGSNGRCGGLQFSESMEMEGAQTRIRLQNRAKQGGGEEMENHFNAQVDYSGRKGGGSRPHKQNEIRQQEAKSKNNSSLGEFSQSRERDGSSFTDRKEKVDSTDFRKKRKALSGLLRDKRFGNGSEDKSGEGVWPSADAGSDGHQSGGFSQNRCTQEESQRFRNKRERFRNDNRRNGESGNTSHASRQGLPIPSCGKQRKVSGPAIEFPWSQFGGVYTTPTGWTDFPTQSPVCDGNDGISDRLVGLTFSSWRNESIKGGGNAVVPNLPFQIFQAIQQYEDQL